MAGLHFELLGGFSVRFEGGQPCPLPTRKAHALLAYLALPAGRFHSREKLTALLWGDTAEVQARQSFRQALFSIRRAVGDGRALLLTQGDTIALNAELVFVDVAELESALTDGSIDGLVRAATLYKGDLLDGFSVDEPPFEEWRIVERERLRERALEGLARLLRQQLLADGPEPAIQTALRILAMDPLQEAVHRALMKLLLRQGRRAAALQQYQVCVASLQRELGAEPEEETRELYREILRAAGHVRGRSAAPPTLTSMATGAGAAEAPMIGRETELARLRSALGQMFDAGGNVVVLNGEAGIGKSRLIQEFAADAAGRGARAVVGRCHETEQTLPLHPWIEALRGDRLTLDPRLRDRLGAATGAELVRVFPELATAGEEPVTLGAQHALLFDALADLIATEATEHPMVLIVEDLHWIDTMSARFLAYLGRRIHRLPVLIVASMRPEELVDGTVLAQALAELRKDGQLDEIVLRSLSEEETRRLARSLHLGVRAGRGGNQIVNDIWAASEGNPFIIVESIRAMRDHARDDDARGIGLARRVQDFVASRLERLGERPRQLVAAAAVIGRDFAFPLLARAARLGEPQAAEVVEELVRRRVLQAVGDRLEFSHDWIRRVAYESLLPTTRAVLHSATGDALEELHRDRLDDVADQLGYHYLHAGDTPKALPHLVRFAELAAQRYALDEAAQAFQQALAAVEQLPASERDRARLDVGLRQAFLLSILGRQHEILEVLRSQAPHLERVSDPLLLSEYYFRLGLTQYFLGDHGASQRAAEHALREAERAGDPGSTGKALHVLSLGAFDAGRPREGMACATRAIPLLDRPRTRPWLGLVYHDLSLNCIAAGALDAALEAAHSVDEIGRTERLPRLRAFAGYSIAWALALQGEHARAIEIAKQTLEFSRDPMVAALVSGAMARSTLEGGDAASAVTVLTGVVAQLGSTLRHGQIRHMALLSEAQLATGNAIAARETATRALELSEADGMPFNLGLARRALGRINDAAGEHAEAGDQFTRALAAFTECEAAFESARTLMDRAPIRARCGDGDGARADLTAAIAAFEAAPAPRRAAQARDLARSLGLTLPSAA